MHFNKTLLATVVVLMTGCATRTPVIQTINPHALPPDRALLLFSIGAETPCRMGTTVLNLKRVSGTVNIFLRLGDFPMNNGYIKSDLPAPSPYTKIHSHLITPGSYEFWVSSAAAPFYQYSHPQFTKPFTVVAGETVYLGEAYVYGCSGDIALEVRDHFDRDMSYLQNLNSMLDPSKVIRRKIEKFDY